jgi:hypothetical protein
MTNFNEHEVQAVIHAIFTKMGYRKPKFSTSAMMEKLFPQVEVVGGDTRGHHALIEVYPKPLPSGRRAVITYNEKAHASTHRFSIAHELAHFIFDTEYGEKSPEKSVCTHGPGEKPASERRADYFASELLVPLWILDEMVDFEIRVRSNDPEAERARDQKIQRLASRFEVSLACMKFRVFDLDHWRKMSRGGASSRERRTHA